MADTTHDAAESETMPPTFVAYPILFLFVSLLIGCAVRWVLERFKSKLHINIPYSVVLLTFGGILGGYLGTSSATRRPPIAGQSA